MRSAALSRYEVHAFRRYLDKQLIALFRKLTRSNGQLIDLPLQMELQEFHRLVFFGNVTLDLLIVIVIEEREHDRSLEARIAYAVGAHAKDVFAQAARTLQEECAHTEPPHIARHGLR